MAGVLVTLDEAKEYLRVDSSGEDATIGIFLATASQLCADVARLDKDKWAIVTGDEDNDDTYSDEMLAKIRELMHTAILYTTAYLFEHREEADHHALTLTLRAILFSIREGAY